MWYVYILYSISGGKTYVGYTNDFERRIYEHNVSEIKGFTLRYRPWELIHKEQYISKTEALSREKFLKTGRGREEVKQYVQKFLDTGILFNRNRNCPINTKSFKKLPKALKMSKKLAFGPNLLSLSRNLF